MSSYTCFVSLKEEEGLWQKSRRAEMERWREGGRECQAAVSWYSLSDCWGSPEVEPKAKGKRACFHEAVCEVLSTSGSGSGSRQWGAAPCWGAQGPVLHWHLAHRVWGVLEDEAYIGVSMEATHSDSQGP